MAIIQLGFTQPLNSSVQIGDTIYYVSTSTTGGFNVGDNAIIMIGVIRLIETELNEESGVTITTITASMNDDDPEPPLDSYIFFSKNNEANLTSILGYYSEVEFKNNSRKKAELFASACGIVESSK